MALVNAPSDVQSMPSVNVVLVPLTDMVPEYVPGVVTHVPPPPLTLGMDCTSLGALTSATLNYTGSQTYMNAMQQASYSTNEVGTLNLQQYNNAISAGGKWPSMSVLAGKLQSSLYEWNIWAPDIYGATSSASDPGPPQWQCIQAFNVNNVAGISCP